jgi:putative flippase GtrA
MLLNQSGMAIKWTALLSFSSAIIVNYILQKLWVFEDMRPVIDSLPKFFTMTLVGYAINSFLLNELSPKFSLPVAQTFTASAIIISNALFSFLWVFAINTKNNS